MTTNSLPADGTSTPAQDGGLKRGAIGLGGAVVMSAALMGPAVSVYFNPQLVAAQAGAATPFVFVISMVASLGIIPVYWLTNVACMRFFRKQRPEQFKPLRHVVLPVLAIALMVIPVYGSIWPVPAAPYDWFPYAVLGYVVLLAAVAGVLGRRRPELLNRAGQVLAGVGEDA